MTRFRHGAPAGLPDFAVCIGFGEHDPRVERNEALQRDALLFKAAAFRHGGEQIANASRTACLAKPEKEDDVLVIHVEQPLVQRIGVEVGEIAVAI